MELGMVGLGKMGADMTARLVLASAITASLMMSRQEESDAAKLLAAVRNQFGGHAVQRKKL